MTIKKTSFIFGWMIHLKSFSTIERKFATENIKNISVFRLCPDD